MIRRIILGAIAFPITVLLSLVLIIGYRAVVHRQEVFVVSALYGNLMLMKITYFLGANVDSPSCPYESCYPPIVGAALGRNNDAARFLVERGADVNVKMGTGTTALIVAAYHGNTEMVRLFISKGADVNAGIDGKTALMFAQERGHADIVELLWQVGAK